MRRVVPLIVIFAMMIGSLTAFAQEATPGVGLATPGAGLEDEAAQTSAEPEFPLAADPALCTVEPRLTEDLLDIWYPPDGTPAAAADITEELPTEVTIPLGEPIDDDSIVAGVTTTVHEVFSCFAAGDYARATALFTDNLVATFGPGPDETREDAAGFLEASPVPEPEEEQTQILAITDVMLLDDGRVSAFAVDEVGTAYVIFEQHGDRWLVDEVFEFSFGDDEEE